MGEIRIVGPGKTRGYPYPVCKKMEVEMPRENRKYVQTTSEFCDKENTLRYHCLR